MITLKVTITGKSDVEERNMYRRVEGELQGLRQLGGGNSVGWKLEELTVPLTLELAAQRVLDELGRGGGKGGRVDDLRRVLAGEYVCVPVEPAL